MRAVAAFRNRRGAHAATINVLADALHRVFTTPANDDGRRRRAVPLSGLLFGFACGRALCRASRARASRGEIEVASECV